MKTLFRKVIILASALLFSLNGFGQVTPVKEPLLIGCWMDSREEIPLNSTLEIYRPCNFKNFPASRFRFKMEIHEKGKCSYLHLASDDAHRMQEGTWTYNAQSAYFEIKDEQGNSVKKFKVIRLEKDLMKIEGVR